MKTKFKLFYLFTALSFVLTSTAKAGATCETRFPIDACFYGVSTGGSSATPPSSDPAHCGQSTERIPVRNIDDMNKAFVTLDQDCKAIRTLKLIGHANEFTFNGIKPFEWQRLQTKNVLLSGAQIYPLGCQMGSGCAGAVQMSMIAKSILKNGGSMMASTTYTYAKGTNPISILGSYRTVDVSEGADGLMKWGMKGFSFGEEESPIKACSGEATKLVNELRADPKLPEACRIRLLKFAEAYLELFSKYSWPEILKIVGDENNPGNIETFLSIKMFKDRYKILCGQ